MINHLVHAADLGYDWIDIEGASKEELQEIAEKYQLHEESVSDLQQPDHLPKYERLKEYNFVILRVYTGDEDPQADTVRELSNKVAVFCSEKFAITIHQHPWKAIEEIREEHIKKGECKRPDHLLNEIIKAALLSFDSPAAKLHATIERYEEHVFLKEKSVSLLKGLYFLKRKVDVVRRLLQLYFDIVDHIDPQESTNAYTRDTRDLYVKQKIIFDGLAENTNHLLSIYFNISSQKTNETIRVLTIFSVFFMPLTFIVGVYGMNFDFMPELHTRWGYPLVLLIMAIVVVSIFIWFRNKKWL
ncbi:MAG TPA: CorA family divalent cation transporter [Chitinophagaceae bacterium]|nr:CorA family divalent cation transporter [Chitinophagaceae bacterium]